jgi:hypothetical protein
MLGDSKIRFGRERTEKSGRTSSAVVQRYRTGKAVYQIRRCTRKRWLGEFREKGRWKYKGNEVTGSEERISQMFRYDREEGRKYWADG